MKKLLIITMFVIFILSSYCTFAAENEIKELNFTITVKDNGEVSVKESLELVNPDSNVINIAPHVLEAISGKISNIKLSNSASSAKLASGDVRADELNTGEYTYVGGDDKKIIYASGRTTKIVFEYDLENILKVYQDCAILDMSFTNLDAKKVTGSFVYPHSASQEGDVHIWKYTKEGDSVISPLDLQKYEFEEKSLNAFRYKVLMPRNMFKSVDKVIEQLISDSIIETEDNTINTANYKKSMLNKVVMAIEGVILLVIVFFTFNYIKESGKTFTEEIGKPIKYSKELPYEDITPGQALYIKDRNMASIGNMFSSTLLNLNYKGIISFEYIGDNQKYENLAIKINQESDTLKAEEKIIFNFLLMCSKKLKREDGLIPIHTIQKILDFDSRYISELKKKIESDTKRSIPLYDGRADNRIKKRFKNLFVYVAIAIIAFIAHRCKLDIFSIHTWIIIISLANVALCSRIVRKTKLFGVEGVKHQEQLKAFERYLKEFANEKNNGLPEIAVWEFYIIYAVDFGIADDVLKELKASYPNIEESSFGNTYRACEDILKFNFDKQFWVNK